jgi:hypothetical protein
VLPHLGARLEQPGGIGPPSGRFVLHSRTAAQPHSRTKGSDAASTRPHPAFGGAVPAFQEV